MKPKSIVHLASRLGLVALLLCISGAAFAQEKDSAAISEALNSARSHAALAHDDSATLESYMRSSMSWQSHARQLQLIKEHANDLLGDFNTLTSLRAEGSTWQREAIDRIDPILREMADHLNRTIDHLNNNQSRFQMQPYKDYVHANLDYMERAHQTISDFVEYDAARSKADDLEKKLEIPAEQSASANPTSE